MKEDLENKVEKKKKKSLWERAFKTKRLDKGDTVAVIYKRENGNAEGMEVKAKHGFFNIDGKVYHERRDCTHIIKIGKERYPLAIINEWGIVPEGTKKWDDKEDQEKCAICQDHIMKGIRHAERVRSGENMGDFKLNTKTIIVGVIMLIVLVAFLTSYV